MKKFEPHYRLVRYGQATKIEKASRQQRTSSFVILISRGWDLTDAVLTMDLNRQAKEEPRQGVPGYGEDEGWLEGQEEVSGQCYHGGSHVTSLRFQIAM